MAPLLRSLVTKERTSNLTIYKPLSVCGESIKPAKPRITLKVMVHVTERIALSSLI